MSKPAVLCSGTTPAGRTNGRERPFPLMETFSATPDMNLLESVDRSYRWGVTSCWTKGNVLTLKGNAHRFLTADFAAFMNTLLQFWGTSVFVFSSTSYFHSNLEVNIVVFASKHLFGNFSYFADCLLHRSRRSTFLKLISLAVKWKQNDAESEKCSIWTDNWTTPGLRASSRCTAKFYFYILRYEMFKNSQIW